ncbi:MAG: hypothetical protein M1831_006225 [Alyxoria varia]|nr:MAG: hypothetical protein M1831_006225 [Alyxoria varia]
MASSSDNASDPTSSRPKVPAPSTEENASTRQQRTKKGLDASASSSLRPSPTRSRETSPKRRSNDVALDQSLSKSSSSSPTRNSSTVASSVATPSLASRSASATDIKSQKAPAAGGNPSKPVASTEQTRLDSDEGRSRAPASSRLTSPPPSSSSRNSSAGSSKPSDAESEQPRSASDTSASNTGDVRNSAPSQQQGTSSSQGVRIPWGTAGISSKLETVEEGDHSGSPSSTFSSTPKPVAADKSAQQLSNKTSAQNRNQTYPSLSKPDSKTISPDPNRAASSQVQAPARQQSGTSMAPAKTRGNNEGTSKNMTVETETVASIPQATTTNVGDKSGGGRSDASGTVRHKPSSETIRPKKEQKKAARKPASILSGTGSSKADIFEAKVARELEDEDTDSDETFVYESNPPEPRSRQSRHHSRTPSATSVHSITERRSGPKTVGHLLEGQRPVRAKRSMKFASNSYAGSSMDDESADPDSGASKATHTRESGGVGRTVGDAQAENESPFSQASKLRVTTGLGSRLQSKPYSPKGWSSPRIKTPTKNGEDLPPAYDSSRTDDEQTPLMGTLRTPRTRMARHVPGRRNQNAQFYAGPSRSRISKLSGCFITLFVVLLVLFGVSGFFFATTKPLSGISIQKIQNVLASEQEIMLDLLVEATNPNIVTVSISDMDLNIFAKSRHVDSERYWRDNPHSYRPRSKQRKVAPRSTSANFTESNERHIHPIHSQDGVDDGTDPIEDPENDSQTMLLGRIRQFDSSLSFEGSPFQRLSQNSTGELRLQYPGNHTGAGGSERWGQVVDHSFELLVRGVFKYQLPLSMKTLSSSVGARITVHPDDNQVVATA